MVSRLGVPLRPPVGTTPDTQRINPLRPEPLRPEPLRPSAKFPAPTPHIELPPKLGRPPTTNDLIIHRTFDGLTPQSAAAKVLSALQGTIAPQNKALVDTTVAARVRDMQAALNNVFTRGTPHGRWLRSLQPADVALLGSLTSSNPIVYRITKPNEAPKFYSRDWSGGFVEMQKPPIQVVMEAQVQLEPAGLRMSYPAWRNTALAGELSTIVEG